MRRTRGLSPQQDGPSHQISELRFINAGLFSLMDYRPSMMALITSELRVFV